ncbi:hypothetical protein G6675_03515 [Polynucleobacter paneuropaeus]|nr:hypothetical protein [Polynucleobacter paneuropaeus]MBT8600015.1 hypothetical protein [Polynucleobacter paneuropaeus]
MNKPKLSKVKILLETYAYVYLTELDHRENINDMNSTLKDAKFENNPYFPMWERSKKALDNLEEYLRLIIDENDGNTTLRKELEKLKTFNTLAEQENTYIDKILKI